MHRSRDIWNAIGVAFYEHLCDDRSLIPDIAPWVSPEALEDTGALMQQRAGSDNFRLLLEAIGKHREDCRYREARRFISVNRQWE